MKPSRVIVVACFVAVTSALANEPAPNDAVSQVVPLSPAVEFGDVTPEMGPATATVSLLIRSDDAPWRVSILRDPSPRRRPAAYGRSGTEESSDLLVRSEEGTWMPMLPGIAVPLASGAATENGAGTLRSLDFQLNATMENEPGTREITFHLLLNGQRSADLPLSYTIAPAMKVAVDERDFRVMASDPSHPGRYEFEPRTCIVASNVPWLLEALISDPAKIAGEATSLPSDALRVISVDGDYKPLVPTPLPVAIATGGPTGRAGTAVQVRLAFFIKGREPGGEYKTAIEFRLTRIDATRR